MRVRGQMKMFGNLKIKEKNVKICMRLNTDYVWNAGEKHDSLISLYAFWEKFGLLSPNF